jgi:hypothetical protein
MNAHRHPTAERATRPEELGARLAGVMLVLALALVAVIAGIAFAVIGDSAQAAPAPIAAMPSTSDPIAEPTPAHSTVAFAPTAPTGTGPALGDGWVDANAPAAKVVAPRAAASTPSTPTSAPQPSPVVAAPAPVAAAPSVEQSAPVTETPSAQPEQHAGCGFEDAEVPGGWVATDCFHTDPETGVTTYDDAATN